MNCDECVWQYVILGKRQKTYGSSQEVAHMFLHKFSANLDHKLWCKPASCYECNLKLGVCGTL